MSTVHWTWETYLDLGDLGEYAAEIVGTIDYNGEYIESSEIKSIKIIIESGLVVLTNKFKSPQKLHTDFEEAFEAHLAEPPDEDHGRGSDR